MKMPAGVNDANMHSRMKQGYQDRRSLHAHERGAETVQTAHKLLSVNTEESQEKKKKIALHNNRTTRSFFLNVSGSQSTRPESPAPPTFFSLMRATLNCRCPFVSLQISIGKQIGSADQCCCCTSPDVLILARLIQRFQPTS